MNYHSTSRNQRPKGCKVKKALQLALLLGICIWLLYQIKHSPDKRKDYGGSTPSKLSEEYGVVILGRKGNVGWSSDGGGSDTRDTNVMGEGEKKEDGGGGDDELDRDAEEKAEEESSHKDNEFRRGNVTTHVEKEDEKKPETQYKESKSNEDSNSDVEVAEGNGVVVLNKDMPKEEFFSKGHENSHGNISDNEERVEGDTERQVSHDVQGDEKDPETQVSHDEQGDEKDPETQVKETRNNKEDSTFTPLRDKDETIGSYKENDDDKEPAKSEEKIARQSSVIDNATVHSQSETANGVLGFHDENGVPQDGNDIVESIPTKSSESGANILQSKTISGLNNQSRIIESMPVEVEEVASKEGSSTTDVETESKSILEDSKNETTNDAEIHSETSVHTDTSSIKHTLETPQEDSRVSEDSQSVSSKQEKEEVTDIKIFPQEEKETESTD